MNGAPLVLVVEDDPQIQILVEETLIESGFASVITASGEQARTLFMDGIDRYRALVTDVKLSGDIDGWQVARCARELNRAIPVIYMTGDSADKWASSGVPHSIILSKPFAPAQVVTAVALLLNAGVSSNDAAQTVDAALDEIVP
jgi:DNA-binding response OmpR family regulator